MLKASELLRDGKSQDLWQMCCGYLRLSTSEFMEVQRRLMTRQLELLNNCELGRKIMGGARPETVDEFRRVVPLTEYKDYCPELLEKKEATLPGKPAQWVHSSGKTGEYTFKWIPMTDEFCQELSAVSYGVGLLSCATRWGDTAVIPECPKIVYAVAPRPYISGALASFLSRQTDVRYMPPLDEAEGLSFEERIRAGFQEALKLGFDYFFGLSLVLVTIGDRFSESSRSASLLPLLKRPRAALRLIKGLLRSKLARRPLLPRDLWKIKGIMCSGLDSFVYRHKIKEMWGRYPLDIYAGSEGGIYATQAWDCDAMTFVPNLNFLEFIPEDELLKWQMDRSYRLQTVLLDEVKAGELYELVISNFHGGSLMRYRPGDMIRITSLKHDKLGFDLPQMVFERRADDVLDFFVVRLTEKTIWQAIEKTGIEYVDWTACKVAGEAVLKIYIELKEGSETGEKEISGKIYQQLMDADNTEKASLLDDGLVDSVGFRVEVIRLAAGTFADFMAQKQAEGADLAHLKPSHINYSESTLSLLIGKSEKAKDVAETGAEKIRA